MTTEKHDPWALLREAKRLIATNRLMLGHYSGVREVASLEDRIDAALAGRDKPVEELNAEERIWRAYRNRELTEDEARERLAALKAEEAR
jgi:hypothetical protein